jgi:hypothetical protein
LALILGLTLLDHVLPVHATCNESNAFGHFAEEPLTLATNKSIFGFLGIPTWISSILGMS